MNINEWSQNWMMHRKRKQELNLADVVSNFKYNQRPLSSQPLSKLKKMKKNLNFNYSHEVNQLKGINKQFN